MSYFGKFSDADQRRRIKTSEIVQESQAVRRAPYVISGFITMCLVRIVTTRLTARKFFIEFTHNIYFTTAYLLAVVGVFNYLRFYYRDQFRSYGLYGHSPGVAEQTQPQNVATFTFVTLPTVLEKSKLLMSPEVALPNQLAKFSITPLVDRVDVYPESLVVQLNEAWADLMARNFYITYPLAANQLRDSNPGLDLMTVSPVTGLSRVGFAATRSNIDLHGRAGHYTQYLDPWASVRGMFEVLDEFPLKIEQSLFSITSDTTPRLYTPPVLRVVNSWAQLPTTTESDSLMRLCESESTALLDFQAGSSSVYPTFIGASETRQRSTLLDEFFDAEVLRADEDHRSVTDVKAYGVGPRTRLQRTRRSSRLARLFSRMLHPRRRAKALSSAKRRRPALFPRMLVKSKQLRLIDAASPEVLQLQHLERPVPPLDVVSRQEREARRHAALASGWERFQSNACFVGTSLKTVVSDVGRVFFTGKKVKARPGAVPVPATKGPETILEEIQREEADNKRQAGREYFLSTRPKSVQAYVRAVQRYRRQLRAYNANMAVQKQKLRSKQCRYATALRRYEDVQAFWAHTLPHMIRTATVGPVSVESRFIADSTSCTEDAWVRALTMLDRYELLDAPDSTDTIRVGGASSSAPFTEQNIARFIGYSLWQSTVAKSPAFKYYHSAPQFQRSVTFLPYTDLGLPYPKPLISALIEAEAGGGYEAFYEVLSRCGVSTGPAQSNPAVFNFKNPPAEQHFQPIIDWMRAVSAGAISLSTPITKPPGNEYHWAVSMKRLLASEAGVAQLVNELRTVVGGAPRQLATLHAIVEKVHTEVQVYFDQIQTISLEAAIENPHGMQYAGLLADLNSFIACSHDLESHLRNSLVFGHIRRDARAVSELIAEAYPHMHGFAFPDHMRDQIQTQWMHAMPRYNLTATTPWHNFKTMFQRRLLEVPIPAGYRPFMEDVFSTTYTPPQRSVDIVPRYVFDRQLAYYPSYYDLQNLYGDLDVSFLPEKPLPKAVMAAYDREERTYGEEENPVELQKEYYFKILRALQRAPFTGDARIELKNRDAVHTFVDVALSASNWVKDRPSNFRGQTACMLSDPKNRGQDQHQIMIARMGARPSFNEDSDFLSSDALSIEQQKHDFPLKLHGYRREFYYCNNLESLTPEEKDALLEKYAQHRAALDVAQGLAGRRLGWFLWFNAAREAPQLATQDDIILPRLTMDEWHALFKTALQTAQTTKDPDFLVDLPPLVLQGAGISQPAGFRSTMFDTRTRSSVLTQVLMAITEHNYGAYDLVGYENIANIVNYYDQQDAHAGRQPRIVAHFDMPREEIQPEPTGAPTWLESSSWRIPSHGGGRWASAERYILETAGYAKKPRDWSKITKPILGVLQKLPGGKKLTRHHVFHDNLEPITAYWWCYGGKLVFYMWLYRIFWFMWGTSWEELKLVLLENFGGRRLRSLFVDLGLENPFSYRVIMENPNTFAKSAGALNPTLFVQACESVVHLRNKCRPGTMMPKGLLLTGVPGTGKTFMVQMIAGEAGVPVITQTAGELFNKRNAADLDIDQLFTPAEQLGFAFERARDLAPSILFIDEIDALGKSRENVQMSTLDKRPDPRQDLYGYVRVKHTPPHIPLVPKRGLKERSILEILSRRTLETFRDVQRKWLSYEPYPGEEPIRTEEIFVYKEELERQEVQQVGTLTEFLVQMDGIRPLEGVLVIGATNRIEVLDPAITRSGRLEQIVELFPPGARERLQIFQKECFKLGAVPDTSWNYLVNRTRGLTVANLTTAINHSAIRAITLNSLHTIETLEYGLDTMRRHQLALKMIATRPMTNPATARSRDPYLFLRVAYYNAGKVLLQNVLPTHPSLAYAKLAVEPFQPEYRIRDLLIHNYARTDLEIRLIGLHAGKAAEYLMLYGTKPEGILPSTIHLLESDQGADELVFAAELANAMVDEWFLYDDKRIPLRINARTNDNLRNFLRPQDVEPRETLEYWLHTNSKAFARLPSDRDAPPFDSRTKSYPPGHTIYQRYEEMAYWATRISRIELNAITQDYIKWFNYYAPEPFKGERSRFWIPPDYYFHQDPSTFIDYDNFMKFINESDVDWDSVGKGWEEQIREWDPTGEMLPESKRPMLTFPDWRLVDRDYIMQSLMGISFETALNVLQEFRPLLDTLAAHILENKIIREDTIHRYIREYTETRVKVGAQTPIQLSDFSNTDALAGLRSNIPPDDDDATLPPLIAPIDYIRPSEEFELTEENQFLHYERSWGPASRKPAGKKIPLTYFNNPGILKRDISITRDFTDALFALDSSDVPIAQFEDSGYPSDDETDAERMADGGQSYVSDEASQSSTEPSA